VSDLQRQLERSGSNRLSIGTAQFGLPYGVANESGQVPVSVASSILSEARAAGVDTLDTAIAYGVSELALGEIGMSGWRITTKLPALPEAIDDVLGWVSRSIAESLDRLRVSRVDGLLLHRPADLVGPHGAALATALNAALDRQSVGRLGISIYQPGELDQVWGRLPFEIVQCPFNVFDRRIESSGWLAKLADEGVEVHTRSAFLQGLLIMAPDRRPTWSRRWATLFARWEEWLASSGVPAVRACLAFVLARARVSRVVVGVDSLYQMRELLAASRVTLAALPPPGLSADDPDLLDPSRWPRA
jgi:aryl-alcohol dehydrogenase-like predicted oxidoreductase